MSILSIEASIPPPSGSSDDFNAFKNPFIILVKRSTVVVTLSFFFSSSCSSSFYMRFPPLPIFTTGFCFFGLGPLIPSPFSVPSGALITRKVPPELVALLANSNSFFKFTSRVIFMDAFKLSVNLFVFLRNWPFRVSMRFPCRFFAICFFLKFKAASCCDAEDDELCFFFLNDDDCGIYICTLNDDDFGGNFGDDFFFFTSSSLSSSEKRKVAKGQIVVDE
tara:strand:+ start:173 stop:835 length:663 start_codon:yes stop_codon:yes gene_type:complete